MPLLENYWNWDWDSDIESGHRDQFVFLGYEKLADNFVFIRDDYVFDNLYEESEEYFIEKVEECIRITDRIPIFCLDNNEFDIFYVNSVLKKFLDDKKYFILTYDANALNSTNPNIGYWPFFLIRQYLENNLTLGETIDIPVKRHRLSFLSGIARYHRILLVEKLKQHFTTEDVVIVNDFNKNAYIDTIPKHVANDQKLRNHASNLLETVPCKFGNCYRDINRKSEHISKPWDMSHPAYSSAVNITGETSYHEHETFITEKTWKAYQSGCLVINYGPKNLPTVLNNMGIEIAEEIDPPLYFSDKINFLQTCLDKIEIWDLYHGNKKMIEYNTNLIKSRAFLSNLTSLTIEKISDKI